MDASTFWEMIALLLRLGLPSRHPAATAVNFGTAPPRRASLALQALHERNGIGWGAEQQHGIIGRSDPVTHHEWVVIDVFALGALLRRRTREGQCAGLELLAVLRPQYCRVGFRIARLADRYPHVPPYWPLLDAIDQGLL